MKAPGGDRSTRSALRVAAALGIGAVVAAIGLAACAPAPVKPPPPVIPTVPVERCESCHNSSPHPGCDGVAGTADDAPNVMGDGVSADGKGRKPKPFDDGTFGFNVNGHGANGTASRAPLPSLDPDLGCAACHDLASPDPGTHLSCVGDVDRELNTRAWPGKPADTRTSNTAHLVAGFLPGKGGPRERQLAFDDHCFTACHRDAGVPDMRHSTKVKGVPDGIVEFAEANDTTDDPKQDRGLDRSWTPWTIDDLDVGVDADPPDVPFHGTCVSCHDPHGTAVVQRTRGTNKMVIHNWKGSSMQQFCNNNCHRMP